MKIHIISVLFVFSIMGFSFWKGIKYQKALHQHETQVTLDNVMAIEICQQNYLSEVASKLVYEESRNKEYNKYYKQMELIGESLCRDFAYNGMLYTPGWWNTEEYIHYVKKKNNNNE